MNALTFSDTNVLFKRMYRGEKELEKYDLTLEKLKRPKKIWNEDRMKR